MENQGGNTNKVRRTLTPEQKRRILEKRRKARLKKRLMIIVPIALIVLAAVGMIRQGTRRLTEHKNTIQ